MNTDILITTSDNFSSSDIEKQLGIVDSQIVVGANIFRDVFAGFRDLFGGETKGYKKDIDKMKKGAFSNIKAQANQRGANAVISVRIDLDEVSGGGKSMFMLNVYGSAVKLEESALESDQVNDTIDEITIEDVKYYKTRNHLQNRISQSKKVDINKISKYSLWTEEKALEVLSNSPNPKRVIIDNLSEIPIQYIEKFLINKIHLPELHYWDSIYDNLSARNWFNYDLINQLLREENHVKRFRGLKLCTITKDFYEKDEIAKLNSLGDFLATDFDTSVQTKKVDKMIGSKEVYVCPYCLRETKIDSHSECGKNKYGLTSTTSPKQISDNLLNTAIALDSAIKNIN